VLAVHAAARVAPADSCSPADRLQEDREISHRSEIERGGAVRMFRCRVRITLDNLAIELRFPLSLGFA